MSAIPLDVSAKKPGKPAAPKVPKAWGEILKSESARLGISRDELAKLANVGTNTVWRVETGHQDSSVKAAAGLRAVLLERGAVIPPVPVGVEDWTPDAVAAPANTTPSAGDSDEEIIRKNLIRFREQAEHDQFSAASAAGIPYEDLRRYELGEVEPPNSALRKLSTVYGREPGDFFKVAPPPLDPNTVPELWWRGRPEVVKTISEEDKRRIDELMREIAEKSRPTKKAMIEHITKASKRRRS